MSISNSNEQKLVTSDEISIKEIILKIQAWFRLLLSKKWSILIFALIGGVLGYFLASIQPLKYVATTTFVLEEESPLQQYSGLGAIIGRNMDNSAGIFQGENLFELYKSRIMIRRTLLNTVTIDGKPEKLINRYLKFNHIREGWEKKNVPWKSVSFDQDEKYTNTRVKDSILRNIIKDINANYLTIAKLDKKLSIIQVQVSAEDETFAMVFNKQIVKNVNDFYVQTKTSKSNESLTILQYQADSIRSALNQSISNIATSVDANPNVNPARQILRVPSQKQQVNVESEKAMLSEIVKNIELNKISMRRDKPLIQVIDSPFFPLDTVKTSNLVGLVLGSILFVFLVIGYVTLSGTYRHIMKS